MKRWWQLEEFHVALLIIVLVASILFESLFLRDTTSHVTLSVTTGIAFTAMMIHQRKVLPYIFIATLFGFYLQAEIYLNFFWTDSVLFAICKAAILLVILEISRALIFNSKLLSIIHSQRIEALLLFVSVAVIAALSASLMNLIYCALIGPTIITGGLCVYSTFFSTFSGIVIISPLLYMSNNEMRTGLIKHSTFKYFIYGVFLITFTVLNYLLIIGIFQFQFSRHLYIITGFFIAAALLFSYRFLFVMTMIFLMLYGVFYHNPLWSYFDFLIASSTLYVFLLITLVISLIIKEYVETQQQQYIELNQMNRQLQKTLDYVHKFFSLSKKIITNCQDHELYAKDTFDLTNMLFENADASFAYFDNSGKIDMLASKNYPIKQIPLLYELHNSDLFKSRDVFYIRNIEKRLKMLYENVTVLNKYQYLKDGKRVYVVFRFSIDKHLIVGLDYYKEARKFDTNIVQKIQDFTGLLNKLFLKQQVAKQNRMLKDDIIRAFVRTLDLYDRYTKGHSEDVAMISYEIAKRINDDDNFHNAVYWAGLLHDIGKLGVSYDILNKDGRLTDDEYAHIKEHVNFSYNVLLDNEDLKDIAVMVRDHHERIDGKGYPRGVKDPEISLGGKIIAVADAVATMATDRPYRKRVMPKKIAQELKEHSGTQFSKDIVDIMDSLLENNILAKIN